MPLDATVLLYAVARESPYQRMARGLSPTPCFARRRRPSRIVSMAGKLSEQ